MSRRMLVLLGLAAALALMRFALLPWLEGQAVAREELAVLTLQLEKATALQQREAELREGLAATRARHLALLSPFPQPSDDGEVRRGAQRSLTASIEQHAAVSLEAYEWVFDAPVDGTGLTRGRVRLTVEGPLHALARWQLEVERSLPHMAIAEFELSARRGAAGPSDRAQVRVDIDVYYRRGDVE